ncbi:MAG: TraR/DksA C4-type zinc finger protein [Chloroflexi bacterium]|nr:TraR/DksA C4-type zinc finger protein [Chloroflexota bacterium]MBP8057713.1 TraR/DksA C4-type zinc finger protein [Chloroflexota bacterium]
MNTLTDLLDQCARLHQHLCPRQVLGVRMGLLAGRLLAIPLPQTAKRLLTIMETDGCFSDGVATATNCWVGRRTLRVVDLGKIAATFVDTQTDQAIRLIPTRNSRSLATLYAPEAQSQWESYLLGYQYIPDEQLFDQQAVQLITSSAQLISRAGARVNCAQCGEEIINEREVWRNGIILCRSCAGETYYYSNTMTDFWACQPLPMAEQPFDMVTLS